MSNGRSMNVGDANATFSATIVDQWVRCGLRAAFVAPGSRSTPLAIALSARSEIRLELFHDERSASFAALGWGLATGTPAVLLCTSGTAATHFHGAVAEAGISCVPMLVCTANRPPELWGIGAPQTIDQSDLYRSSVRAFIQPGPPDDSEPSNWRSVANQSWLAAANRNNPGPVQLDLSFREPLLGEVLELPPAADPAGVGSPVRPTPAEISAVVDRLLDTGGAIRPGVIVAGRGESDPVALVELATALGWPIVADHRSGLRDGSALRFHDAALRLSKDNGQPSDLARSTQRILRFGEPLSSKVLGQWIARIGTDPDAVTGFAPWSRIINPERVIVHQLAEHSAAQMLLDELKVRSSRQGGLTPYENWGIRWNDRDTELAARFDSMELTEAKIAAQTLGSVPAGGALVVSSSMPVRDVEWFGPDSSVSVYSNRGANGIDGVVATAIGVACTGVPTVCLIGDVAFLHDQTSLIALARRQVDLRIVVVDNDGGGIFSFLPQHEQLDEGTYEQLFGTPHGTDLAALCAAHGLEVGTDVEIHRTDRDLSLAQRQAFVE